jgi:fucose permease
MDGRMKIWKKRTITPNVGLAFLAVIAFIALGIPDGLLGVAWPSIRAGFNLPIDALGMLLPVSVAGYLTSSFSSGVLSSRYGIGKILAVSCALTGVALIGYTLVPAWWMMISLRFLAGLGAGAIDAGLNSFVAAHYGERMMQWLHASYGIGITAGPIIMTMAISTLNSWHAGYREVGVFQLVLAACFSLALPLWGRIGPSADQDAAKLITDYRTPMRETLAQSRVWVSALLFFLYVGSEVSLGNWGYSLLTEQRGVGPTLAGFVTGSYWATFTVGRILAGLYTRKIGTNRILQISLIGALAGALLLIWNPSESVNLIAVALIGFAIAPIFPALMSGTSKRVGDAYTVNTIGMQMAASGLGTAVIPSLLGVLARRLSLDVVPVYLAVSFLLLFLLHRSTLTGAKNER